MRPIYLFDFVALRKHESYKLYHLNLGWYLVWKLFLSRFRFVRELLMINNNQHGPVSDRPVRNAPTRRRAARAE